MRWNLVWVGLSLCMLVGCPPAETPSGSTDNTGGDTNGTTDMPASLTPQEPAPTPAAGSKTLLSEVLFDPAADQSQFVELKMGTDGVAASTLKLRNAAGDEFALPSHAPQPAAGGALLVQFDGQSKVDQGVVHADRGAFLDPNSDAVSLLDANDNQLDHMEWGADRADAVALGGGGVVGIVGHGAALARRPHSTTPDQPDDWTLVPASYATPGGPNYNPGVGQLFPADGAISDERPIELSWFPAPGAARYHVQVASDAALSTILLEGDVEAPPYEADLAPGAYYWRVQAIAEDDSGSDYSETQELQIVASVEDFAAQVEAAGAAGKAGGRGQFRLELSQRIPTYAQRKDTPMLLLESDQKTGTSHAWNAPHPTTDARDPADNCNCTVCVASMVNAFLLGAGPNDRPPLSQDRIALEEFTKYDNLDDGPERDFIYGHGLSDPAYKTMLEFAVGAPVKGTRVTKEMADNISEHGMYDPKFRDEVWQHAIQSLARNRPMPLSIITDAKGTNKHALLVRGVLQDKSRRYMWVNDPWRGRSYLTPLERLKVVVYFELPDDTNPPRDEQDLRDEVDSDGDAILDFDEEMRFKTDKNDRDSDDDCIDDFEEVELSVFDKKHGWGQFWSSRARHQFPSSDGLARSNKQPELTADSDGGGLPDFMEDINGNGTIEPALGESDPFDRTDDARMITGTLTRVRNDREEVTDRYQKWAYEFHVHTTESGVAEGTADVTYDWKNTYRAQAAPPTCPDPRVIITQGDQVKQTIQVEIKFQCSRDHQHAPVLLITEKVPKFRFYPQGTIMDPCTGNQPVVPLGTSVFPLIGMDDDLAHFFPTAGQVRWMFDDPREEGTVTDWDLTMTAN